MTIKKLSFCLAASGLMFLIQSPPLAANAASSHSHGVETSRGEKARAHKKIVVAQHGHMQHEVDPSQMKAMGDEKHGERAHEHPDHLETMPPRSALQPAEGAKVEILSPGPKQVFRGDEILLRYRFVKGKKGHHVHAYIDGTLMGMFKRDDGTLIGEGTLTGVKPGWHTLELRTVTADHKTELDAIDVVEFSIQSQ